MMEWCNGSGKEHALVISNHRSDIDWLVGWIIAQVSSSLSLLDLFAISIHNSFQWFDSDGGWSDSVWQGEINLAEN
jgi:hypothetical protein